MYVKRNAQQESVLEKLDELAQQDKIAKLEVETKDTVIKGMKSEGERYDEKKSLLTKVRELFGIEVETEKFKNKHFKTRLYRVEKDAIIRETEKDPLEASDTHKKGQEAFDNTKALSNGSSNKTESHNSSPQNTASNETE